MAHGQLTEEHTFRPAVAARRSRCHASNAKLAVKTVSTVSTATQTEAEMPEVPRANSSQGRTPRRSMSPSSRPRSGRLSLPTASFLQRATKAPSIPPVSPVSVPLQKWGLQGLQNEAQSLAALAFAAVGSVASHAATAGHALHASSVSQNPPDDTCAVPCSPEHAGPVPCAVDEAQARPLCAHSVEDVHSKMAKAASHPEVERPSVIAEDPPSDRESSESADGEIPALPTVHFEDVRVSQAPLGGCRVRFSPPRQIDAHERAAPRQRRPSSFAFDSPSFAPECVHSSHKSHNVDPGSAIKAKPCRFSWEEVAPVSADSGTGSGASSEAEQEDVGDMGTGPIRYMSFVLPRATSYNESLKQQAHRES